MSPAPQIARFTDDDLPPTQNPALIDQPESAPAPSGMFAKLAADREQMLSETVELRAYVPTWRKRLVGVFTPLTVREAEALQARIKSRTDVSTEMQGYLASCDLIASACRRLEYDGEQVPGAVTVSGFTAEFGTILKGLKPDATAPDIVWVAFGKSPELVGRFVQKLDKWFEDPTPQEAVDGPFGAAFAA